MRQSQRRLWIRARIPLMRYRANTCGAADLSRPLRAFAFIMLWSAALINGPALAQTVDTNRPGFSFSPNTIADGQWQLETGIAYTRFGSSTSSVALPLAEFRFGLSNNMEMFVASVGWTEFRTPGGDNSGLADMSVGTKIKISDAADTAQMALLFQLNVPVGDSELSSDRFDPSLAFVWTHNGSFPLAGTVKFSDFESGFQLDNGLKLPFSLGSSQSAFVEWEVNIPEDGGSAHWLNGGYQWLNTSRMQFDVNAGLGLNDEAGDYRMGIGFSMLF